MERRSFIKTTAVGAAGIALGPSATASAISAPEKAKRPIHVFTKCLQFLNYDEMAEVLVQNGFDGADLAVRPGGQVLPENVERDLPIVMNALKKVGLGSNMIVTRLTDPEDPALRPTLKTMAELGIQYYRMGYIKYDDKKSVLENLEIQKKTFEEFEKLNKEFGVSGSYQNHYGIMIGGPIWDLYHILKDRNPEYIGIQYDVRHATVEGGVSWPLGMKLLAPWIRTTAIKDFIWAKNEEGQWKVKKVPLGEGMVDFDKYFEMYKEMNIEAPVTIHYEYDLGGAELGKRNPTMSLEEINKWLRHDLTILKNQFKKYGL